MKIRLGVIGEAENIDIFREVIEEYNDYEIATFIDADGTHTLNIIDTHQQDFDSWLIFVHTFTFPAGVRLRDKLSAYKKLGQSTKACLLHSLLRCQLL